MISLCFSIHSGKVLCTLRMVVLLHNICETVVHYLPRNGYLRMEKRRWEGQGRDDVLSFHWFPFLTNNGLLPRPSLTFLSV